MSTIRTLPSLLTLRQAADRLGISTESARKRAFRTKTLAPGVPIVRGEGNGHRFVRSTDLDTLIYGTKSAIPTERFVLPSEVALVLGVSENEIATQYPELGRDHVNCRVIGTPDYVTINLYSRRSLNEVLEARA